MHLLQEDSYTQEAVQQPSQGERVREHLSVHR